MDSVVEQSLVFIGAAVILVPIFQRFGFGSVLGYLIAGMLVGPFGFKFIEDSESVMHFSELGVVFLLFIIGLEIQPRKLWGMREHLLGLGGLQVLLCTTVFALIGLQFGLSLLIASILGFALSLSSTAFALQSLAERNQLNTVFGRGSFSVLLMQDLLAIPALAVLGTLKANSVSDGHGSDSPQSFLWAFLIIIALVLVSRFLIRPVFRVIASTRSREMFTAVTLFIVLGVSALMIKVGLSGALGAFIAGVLLADSEYRHELEADLEPFKALLMGLFFIAIGMGVNLDIIYAKPVQMLALAVAYMTVKAFIIYGVARVLKLNHENGKQMAINISQGGEFAFVMFGIVAAMGAVEGDLLPTLTVMVTLSMALSPLVSLADIQYNKRKQKISERSFDEIKEEAPEVIVAGYGRFGQIFGRILKAQEIPFVAIDHDSDHIDLLRRFKNKVYYGDASRKDILEAAGAAKAKYFVLAIDDVDMSVKTAKVVKENFPNLKIFGRARNRGHAFDLMDVGVPFIKRETFDSSVAFVEDLLVDMGFAREKIKIYIERFKAHDLLMLEEQFKVRNDDKMFMNVSNQGAAQLAQVLKDDTEQSRISR